MYIDPNNVQFIVNQTKMINISTIFDFTSSIKLFHFYTPLTYNILTLFLMVIIKWFISNQFLILL